MDFFKNVPGNLNLQPYNTYHFLALGVTLLLAILIISFRKQLRKDKLARRVRVISTIIAPIKLIGCS